MLDFYRATLMLKCSGLGEEDLVRLAVPPSARSKEIAQGADLDSISVKGGWDAQRQASGTSTCISSRSTRHCGHADLIREVIDGQVGH
jgi:hypothetical protein